MGHKLQATLHHLLLQLQDSTKYDSICFMLQDLHSRQSITGYNSSGLPNYVDELAAEWPEYSGFPSYPIRPAPYITTYSDVRDGFWIARRNKTLWVGEYGAARQSLLDFLIERTAP
jgi:hypothetical protein